MVKNFSSSDLNSPTVFSTLVRAASKLSIDELASFTGGSTEDADAIITVRFIGFKEGERAAVSRGGRGAGFHLVGDVAALFGWCSDLRVCPVRSMFFGPPLEISELYSLNACSCRLGCSCSCDSCILAHKLLAYLYMPRGDRISHQLSVPLCLGLRPRGAHG